MERYTPNGIKCIINGLHKKESELHDATVSMAHRKQDEHARYQDMTESEFKRYKIENMRYFIRERKRISAEIKKWERMLEHIS